MSMSVCLSITDSIVPLGASATFVATGIKSLLSPIGQYSKALYRQFNGPRTTYACIDDARMTICGLYVRHTPWCIGRPGGQAHSRKLRKPERSSAILKHRTVSAREARDNTMGVQGVILYCANMSLVCQKMLGSTWALFPHPARGVILQHVMPWSV
ncbi:hypothetical protein L227DRAFT_163610 [Lentinus tigrinus ALCF2SS1-6]|uniref:Uncharacterized protein n=1 Tax=Lentinus tigrinus ALCF2SS1-6 TaxID=1328759 RepID=A0A5C2SCQ6_9APHY|nr:hypothetical protein L227DRAFT_163610 [Lentinus tigrinus ALCF2SS1-6]